MDLVVLWDIFLPALSIIVGEVKKTELVFQQQTLFSNIFSSGMEETKTKCRYLLIGPEKSVCKRLT